MKCYKSPNYDIYLSDTSVENIFICEFMPSAEGDFVKVYLYGKLLAENGKNFSMKDFAAQLALSESRVLAAFEYWEKFGLIRRIYAKNDSEDFDVEFLSLKNMMFGAGTEQDEDESSNYDSQRPLSDALSGVPDSQTVSASQGAAGSPSGPVSRPAGSPSGSGSRAAGSPSGHSISYEQAERDFMALLEMKLSRTLSSSDMAAVISWQKDLGLPDEVISIAVDHCAGMGKTRMRYIGKVLENWAEEGINTPEAARAYIEQNDAKSGRYRRVMQALGFSRNPSEEERRLIDEWFDEMGFGMEKVIEACAKTAAISNPNIKYVNSVLRNWKREADEGGRDVNAKKPVSMAVLNRYYDYLRTKAKKEQEQRRSEVYGKLPDVKKIDNQINRLGIELSKALITNSSEKPLSSLQAEMEKLREERAVILTSHNYDMDYTDIKYLCDKCNDTGVTDAGVRCSCVEQRMAEAAIWQKQREKEGKK